MAKGFGFGEALALIEIGKQMAKKPDDDKKPERTRKEKPKSWEELWLEEQQRRAKFDDFMKVLKKQLGDDKDKDKKSSLFDVNVDRVALLLLALVPVNWAMMYLLLH